MMVSEDLVQELSSQVAGADASGLKEIAERVLGGTVQQLRDGSDSGDLEAITDEWLQQLDDKYNLPGPDAVVVKVLDWFLTPERLLGLLKHASAKLGG